MTIQIWASIIRIRDRLKTATIDSHGVYFYSWSGIVALVCFYNILATCILVFDEFYNDYYTLWIAGNVISDAVNLVDLFVQSRKEYLDDGVCMKDPALTAKNYFSSTPFLLDIGSTFPMDWILLFQWPQMSLLRVNRFSKIYRMREFIRLTEIRTNFPHLFQVIRLTFICYAIFHWNGCIYFLLSTIYGMDNADVNDWIFTYSKIPDLVYSTCDTRFDNNICLFNESEKDWKMRDCYVEDMMSFWENRTRSTNFSNLTKQYGLSFYWSALTLVTLGEQPWPNNSIEMSFEILDTLLGLLLLAVVIGDIGIMVTQKNFAKMNYEKFIDGCKRYMRFREVHLLLQSKIINWFEYFWIQEQKGQAKVDERDIFKFLPPRLSKDLACEIHLETLRKVPLFQECDENILYEFISNLQLQIYSPGDYICYKGEIGKEMYIVKRGELEVIDAEGRVCVTLGEGAVFGELSVLRIPGNINGNRRTATVRSKGFVDLYVLTKRDLWRTVNDFPDAKEKLIEKGKTILRKDNLLSEEEILSDESDDGLEYSMHEKLLRARKRMEKLTQAVDEFESKFVESSQNLKQWMTQCEREYRRQRSLYYSRLNAEY